MLDFFWKNLNMEKFCAYPSIPTPKGHQSVPYMARKEPKGKTYYIQNIHLELHLEHTFRITFRNYISNSHQNYIHLHHTLVPLFTPTLAHAYLYPHLHPHFQNYIQKLHLKHTLELLQNYPPAHTYAFSYHFTSKISPIIITFRITL